MPDATIVPEFISITTEPITKQTTIPTDTHRSDRIRIIAKEPRMPEQSLSGQRGVERVDPVPAKRRLSHRGISHSGRSLISDLRSRKLPIERIIAG
ncbi:hypothetical protein BN903_26 [Halorubrum sp. AJ67]|nr:hypothetical protein BN903_26 [Halorubrum sp. AJ67]